MDVNLKKYFPMIRERKEVFAEIEEDEELKSKFNSWTQEQQEIFLDFCTGVRGLKLLNDGFFKEIMNPEKHLHRMNDFLSHILGQKIKVLKVLPTDSTRIADESSLVIMDIVVELEDGSIANVEMQRVGYMFPGQRSACYSADLLLRQYKRVRSENGKKFSYRDIKNVYTIVLYEKSPKVFKEFPNCYYHYFEQTSNTGLKMDLLQKYLFIPLDIFLENQHNKYDKRDAWLMLLSEDEPTQIIELIEIYPEFKEIYEEAYDICCNVRGVMEMFSKELYELDKNTVQYMIDEMQDTIDSQKDTIDSQKDTIDSQKDTIDSQKDTIDSQKDTIDSQKSIIEKSIMHTIKMMRELKIPEEEMVHAIMEQYQLSNIQVETYMKK